MWGGPANHRQICGNHRNCETNIPHTPSQWVALQAENEPVAQSIAPRANAENCRLSWKLEGDYAVGGARPSPGARGALPKATTFSRTNSSAINAGRIKRACASEARAVRPDVVPSPRPSQSAAKHNRSANHPNRRAANRLSRHATNVHSANPHAPFLGPARASNSLARAAPRVGHGRCPGSTTRSAR